MNLDEDTLKKLVLIPCESKKHLDIWLRTFLGVQLVDTTVSRFANTNPLDAAWLLYDRALHSKIKEPLNVMYIASRGSQKTLLSAAVEMAILLHDRRAVLHYAAASSSVEAGYKYLREFFNKKYIKDFLVGKVTNDGADVNLPDYRDPSAPYELVPLRVFPITLHSSQGQHAPALFIDELITLSFDKLKAYKDLSGIPIPTKDGRPYIRGEISSRRGSFSVVESKLADAHKTKLKVASWTIFEMTEKCPDERSGVLPTNYFINIVKGAALTVNKYDSLSESEQAGYQEVSALDKCTGCSLLPYCQSDAKKQTSNNPHLRSIESVIQESEQNSIEWFLSQKMSLMPSTEGLIYNKFKKDSHVIDSSRMWEILTGIKPENAPSHTQLISKFKEMGAKCFLGVDHTGGSAPCAVCVVFIDKKGTAYLVDEIYEPGLELDDLVSILKRLHLQYQFDMAYADPASSDKNKLIKKHGIPLYCSFKKDISAGIEIVRSKLMSSMGGISFYILQGKTEETINEFGKYHFKESADGQFTADPAEEYSHLCDATRYLFQNIFGRSGDFTAPEYTKQENDALQQATYNSSTVLDLIVKKQMADIMKKLTDGTEVKIESGDGFHWSFE